MTPQPASRWWPCPHQVGDCLRWLIESDDRYVARIRRTGKDGYLVWTTKDRKRALKTNHEAALVVAVLMQERDGQS